VLPGANAGGNAAVRYARGDGGRGPSSFCIPRAALEALLREQATAYDICTYLTLARFTDGTGCYSTASVTAVNTYTGANKTRSGPVARALARLQTIRALQPERQKRKHCADVGPIVLAAETWTRSTGEVLTPGGTDRSTIKYVLPDFGEPLHDRVWFGGNLVTGVGEFAKPLKALKNAGDVAARLLLALYAADDMETWGGISPHDGVWYRYVLKDNVETKGGACLMRWTKQSEVFTSALLRIWRPVGTAGDTDWKLHREAGSPMFRAFKALEALGLVYEVVVVLNRLGDLSKFDNGDTFHAIPSDAEPLYVVDTRSSHGYKPRGEEGLAGLTARTAAAFGRPVADRDGIFDLTYAAFVPTGVEAMVVGIFRLRFRVSNPKNAGVRHAWARIYENNRDWCEFMQRVRVANGLERTLSPLPESTTPAVEADLSANDDSVPFNSSQ
jgi:hypothetical protein